MIEFSCSACGKRYKLEDQMAGKKAKCKCGNVLLVPEPLMDEEPDVDVDFAPAPPAPPPPPSRIAGRPAAAKPPPVANAPAASAAAMECPSCGSPMASSAVICIECGYDKRTGKRIAGL